MFAGGQTLFYTKNINLKFYLYYKLCGRLNSSTEVSTYFRELGVSVTNTSIMGSGLDDWIYWHFFTITINYNSPQSMAV
jgi:hypothetical protein